MCTSAALLGSALLATGVRLASGGGAATDALFARLCNIDVAPMDRVCQQLLQIFAEAFPHLSDTVARASMAPQLPLRVASEALPLTA